MTPIQRRDVGNAWHVMEAPLSVPAVPLAALAINRALGGLAKIALGRGGAWQLRAELPLVAGAPSPHGRAETEAAFAELCEGAPPSARAERLPGTRLDAAALYALGVAAGWSCTALSDGRIAVDLGLRARVARARIAASGAGGLRVWAELDRVPASLAPVCGRALAIFLARAAAMVRLVRPVITTLGDHATLAFEARWASAPPGAEELGHALAALAVAADLTSREVRALARDPVLADAYLRLDDDTNRVGLSGPTPAAGAPPAYEGGRR